MQLPLNIYYYTSPPIHLLPTSGGVMCARNYLSGFRTQCPWQILLTEPTCTIHYVFLNFFLRLLQFNIVTFVDGRVIELRPVLLHFSRLRPKRKIWNYDFGVTFDRIFGYKFLIYWQPLVRTKNYSGIILMLNVEYNNSATDFPPNGENLKIIKKISFRNVRRHQDNSVPV